MGLGFFFDNARCTGCNTCVAACADYHDLSLGRRYRRVIDYEGGATSCDADGCARTTAFLYHVSIACNHCANPECMRVCPTGAMHKDDLGLVCVSLQKCIGCGYCTMACPYHAPSIDPDLRQSSKCDGCSSRVHEGLAPICVEACPLRALDFGEMGELKRAHPSSASDIVPLPSSSFTSPNLLVNLSPAACNTAEGDGFISNMDAIRNNSEEA